MIVDAIYQSVMSLLLIAGALYASYRLSRKPGEKFFYDNKAGNRQ